MLKLFSSSPSYLDADADTDEIRLATAHDNIDNKDSNVQIEMLELQGRRSSVTVESTTTRKSDAHHVPSRADHREIGIPLAALIPGTFHSHRHRKEPEFSEHLPRPPNLSGLAPVTPKLRGRHFWSDWRVVTAYKVLFMLVFLSNTIVLSTLIGTRSLSLFHTLNAVSTNILAAVLIRQEDLLNLLFRLISKTSPSTPFVIRKHLADFHHFGGVHTGCAVSAILWYIAYVVLSTQIFLNGKDLRAVEYIDMATCYLFIILLLVICVPATPFLRFRHHNTFESAHRFGGWAAIATFWIHTFTTSSSSSGPPLWQHPSLYLLSAITSLLILPWLRIRPVSVTCTRLSSRELSLTFDYDDMPFCSTMRFSISPIFEWHAFATIPLHSSLFAKTTKASILVAESGDWTRRLLANPPSRIWLRDPPTRNFLHMARMFRGILVVATGAGIGPVLSFLASVPAAAPADMSPRSRRVRVLWCTRGPHPDIRRKILVVDPDAVILDSSQGRFDIKGLAGEVVRREGLEAVFVVSNKKITDEIVRGLGRRGVAGYGASFDS